MKRKIFFAAWIISALVSVAGCTNSSVGTNNAGAVTKSTTSPKPAPPPPAPAPSPSAGGTYQGACDYTLNDNFQSSVAAWATGDVEVNNTGNIGTVNRVRITWPQQGFNPLVMVKTVRVGAGGSRDVQFHMALGQQQISNLQNWQLGHNGDSGCTYRVAMIATFGQVSNG